METMNADAGIESAVRDEKLNAVLGHTRLGVLVATAFAVFVALRLRGGAVSDPLIFSWLAAKIGVAAVRIGLHLRYARLGRPGGKAWLDTTDAWLLADGIVWGLAGMLLMGSAVTLAALGVAVMAGVTSVATFGLQFSRRSTAAYAAPILLLTAAGMLLRGDEFGTIGAVGLLMLLGLQLATALASERRLAASVHLRLHAQRLAEEKDAALALALRQSAVKTQFLGSVSHELRTPLHGMLGVARLLHLEAPDESVARRVELIESSGMHLLGLINDLIDLSRLDGGSFKPRSERFDLAALAETLGEVYSVRAGDKGLDFRLELSCTQPCWVVGDAGRVRQVLHNLLGNAVKFTERGGITLHVGRDAATSLLHARVSDTGPGIAAHELERVFEAFEQAGSAAARPLEGTGLGLTLARDLARAMGGDLVLESEPGRGSHAHFTALVADSLAPQADESATPIEPPAPLPGLRVLLAEDDDVNALIATAYLEQLGAEVERVADGAQAVRHALRDVHRPDLVLMDCRMPVLDGLAATREIRRQERTLGLARLPVIALSATGNDIDRDLCRAAGMDDFLPKPCAREELAQTLARWARSATPSTPALPEQPSAVA